MTKPVNSVKTNTWNPALINDQFNKLEKDVTYKLNQARARRNEFSNEGFAKHLNETMQPCRERLAELTQITNEWSKAAQQSYTDLRASLLPTGANGTADALQAELTAARILARGELDYTTAREFFQMEPSPTRTLLIEEAVARGALDSDSIDSFLMEHSDELAAAHSQQQTNSTMMNLINNRATGMEQVMQNKANPALDVDMNIFDGEGYETAYELPTSTTYWDKPTTEIGIRN